VWREEGANDGRGGGWRKASVFVLGMGWAWVGRCRPGRVHRRLFTLASALQLNGSQGGHCKGGADLSSFPAHRSLPPIQAMYLSPVEKLPPAPLPRPSRAPSWWASSLCLSVRCVCGGGCRGVRMRTRFAAVAAVVGDWRVLPPRPSF